MHAALREVLGPSAVQSGSYNKPGYLRLDFAWSRALGEQDRTDIEDVANRALRQDLPVSVDYMTLDEARARGALALFGEAYDPGHVRVVEIGGPWSRELCGGTHVEHSSQVGSVALLGDSSVGAGLRRVEAYVGIEAFRYLATERALVSNLATMLKVPPAELPDRVAALVERLREAEHEIERSRSAALAEQARSLLRDSAQTIAGTQLVTHLLPVAAATAHVRSMVQNVVASMSNGAGVALLASRDGDQLAYAAAVNKRGVAEGLSASTVLEQFANTVGGRGGGSAEIAQGGGGNPSSAESGFDEVRKLLTRAAS